MIVVVDPVWRMAGVAGVQTPAFVERSPSRPFRGRYPAGVAGVQTPAFVERARAIAFRIAILGVSPEFRLRPSLSEECEARLWKRIEEGVAGVQTPAFVERWLTSLECPPHANGCRRSSDSGLR